MKSSGSHVVVYSKRMIDESDQNKLLRISHSILKDNFIPSGLDIVEKGQTLLYMLSSRSKRNIAQADLDFIEKSGSMDDFQGFFKDKQLKLLFDEILEHFIYCIKRKACTQKDAELLMAQCCLNFKATPLEHNVIKSYVSDRFKTGLGADSTRI